MENYLGEIRPFASGQVPQGWAACDGRLLPITSYQALYTLLGTVYGGDGKTTFALPNLQGRASVSSGKDQGGNGYGLGQAGGQPQHVLSVPEMPQHTHGVGASNSTSGSQSTPSSATVLGVGVSDAGQDLNVYGGGSAGGVLAPQTIGGQGGGQGHENRMPYLAVGYCIATAGVYPSRP